MTRVLAMTKRQATTLFEAANEQGGIVEVETPMGLVRLIPAVIAQKTEKVDERSKGYL